jgi:hypothetical protein
VRKRASMPLRLLISLSVKPRERRRLLKNGATTS